MAFEKAVSVKKYKGKVNEDTRVTEEIPKTLGKATIDFSIEGGELTPTLKLKRRVIYKNTQIRSNVHTQEMAIVLATKGSF